MELAGGNDALGVLMRVVIVFDEFEPVLWKRKKASARQKAKLGYGSVPDTGDAPEADPTVQRRQGEEGRVGSVTKHLYSAAVWPPF
jgi:hypothetical protein